MKIDCQHINLIRLVSIFIAIINVCSVIRVSLIKLDETHISASRNTY